MFHLLFIFVTFIFKLVAVNGEKPEYIVTISSINDCEDTDNKILLTKDLVSVMRDKEDSDEQEICIEGFIELTEDLCEDLQMSIRLEKETENGAESVFSTSMDFCESIDHDTAPHKTACEVLGIKSCPVYKKEYHVLDGSSLTVDMSDLNSFMTSENCGEYCGTIVFTCASNPTVLLSCHKLLMSMKENKD